MKEFYQILCDILKSTNKKEINLKDTPLFSLWNQIQYLL